jgi:hypothetical protein
MIIVSSDWCQWVSIENPENGNEGNPIKWNSKEATESMHNKKKDRKSNNISIWIVSLCV